jgi:signal transduction histidine kinase
MLALGLGLGFVYLLAAAIFLLTYDTVLPILPALGGLSAATVLLGVLSWSDERLRLRRLRSAEAARQQFTDMLVHDLKRRMSSILLSLSVLEDAVGAPDKRTKELTATMRASAERMLLLTANLLDVRRMETGRLVLRREPLAALSLLRESLGEHRATAEIAGVTLRLVGDADVAVAGDRGLMSRVLANLLWNALQHAPPGSVVEVGCGPVERGRVAIWVANAGEPIPPSRRKDLFTAFAAGDTHPENSLVASTGLGLAFCRLAVEAHGGTIAVESPRPGHTDGVRVTVVLDVAS